jgi:hypothetical protein
VVAREILGSLSHHLTVDSGGLYPAFFEIERVVPVFKSKNTTTSLITGRSLYSATLVFFTDLKKALDMVDHSIVLANLEHYGVKGELL